MNNVIVFLVSVDPTDPPVQSRNELRKRCTVGCSAGPIESTEERNGADGRSRISNITYCFY